MREGELKLFKAVCIVFSSALLMLSLFGSVKLAGMNQENLELESLLAREEEKNSRLKLELESQISLEALEEYATGKLGMQTPTSGQIIYITIEQEG